MPTALIYLLAVLVPCVVVVVWLVLTSRTSKAENRLTEWAQTKNLVVSSSKRRWLGGGPFDFPLKGDVVVEFWAESPDGKHHHGWARTRSLLPPFTSPSFDVSLE